MENPVSPYTYRRWIVSLFVSVLIAVSSAGCSEDSASSGRAPAGGGGSGGSGGGAVNDGDGFEGAAGGGGSAGPSAGLDSEALVNNPVEELFANTERSPIDFLESSGASPQGYAETVATCYSESGACEESFCAPFAACCVATGGCCMPLESLPLPDSLEFADCSGSTIEDCAAGAGFEANAFGAESPLITSRGLVPNGSPTSEAGALLGDSLNLSNERVTVAVEFVPPIGCNGSCLESAGVGFTPDSGDGRFNGAEVALLYSGSREEVSVLVGDQVVDSFESTDASATWSLVLSPSGSAEVLRDGATLGVYPYEPMLLERARLAFFGRSLFSNTSSAAIARVASAVELCDSPRGWTERVPVSVTVDGSLDPAFTAAAEPSLLDDPTSSTVAFALDGQIYLGEIVDDTIDVSSSTVPLAASESFDVGGVTEPELFSFGETLLLYYTAFDGAGVGSIGSATAVDGELIKDDVPVLTPSGDVVSYESPTVRTRDGLAVLIVRATLASGATELRAFYTSDPAMGWSRIVDGTLEALTRVDDPTEDLTAPSLIVHNSAYQLYYSRRVGTRWTVEVAASDELLFWRPLGEALGPSEDGFDSLGARGLDARSGSDQIDAIYMGQDGVSFGPGRALRPAPSDTAATAF
jgi:hypothetical protein